MRIKWFSLVRITGLFLVLFYHFFKGVFPGGFIGVDVFFTFSGFLITALLIDEFSKNESIDLQGFYRRRFYRIVPPMVFMILLALPFTFLGRRDLVAGIGGQIAASLGFMTNFYEILSGGNYENQFIPHIFVHTWSLAVEVHYYVLWGLAVWLMGKKAKTAGQLRGLIFLSSLGLFLLSFMTMFIGAFMTNNFSTIYFSSLSHAFPFFLGSFLATLTGVTGTTKFFKKTVLQWTFKETSICLGVSLTVLLLLTFFLKFDNRLTYLFGFFLASLAALGMIFGTRVLHEQTPKMKEPFWISFLADVSYGMYLFHWPFYIIFSQLLSNSWAVVLTLLFSLTFAAFSYYLLEPSLQGREPIVFGQKMDVSSLVKPAYYVGAVLTTIMLLLMLTAPKVGTFEQSLITEGLKQADQKMTLTRQKADQSMASQYNVSKGTSLIGDSVTLRANDFLQEAISGIQVDASVSRNLETGLKVYQADIKNKILLQNVVLALGANAINNYQEVLDEIVETLPKGHRLILITPYDGRMIGDKNSSVVKTREYELELAKKYEFITVADWYKIAQEHPEIWSGTDHVHFGADTDTISQGGNLYAETLKAALDEAEKGPVKP